MLENDKKIALNYFYELSRKSTDFSSKKKLSINNLLVHKVNPNNVLIDDIVDINLPKGTFENEINLFYSIACPNFKCEFIFDHPLDHYSFMLLLELARQMSIGVTHKYKDFPIHSIKNTVSNIDVKIHRFAELDYPLIIGCIDNVIKSKPTMQVRDLYFYFIQKDQLCAEIKSGISVMSKELYNRYRISNRQNIVGSADINLITNEDIINQSYNNL